MAPIDAAGLRAALAEGLGEADAVGHRIVHGGERFHEAVLIDAGVAACAARARRTSRRCTSRSRWLRSTRYRRRYQRCPAVACFDTAFHATLPPAARTYALPASWRERWGIRRYGFHGLSHAWVARRAPELLGATRTRATDRELPPRRRCLAVRHRRGPLNRHDDGVHAAGGPGHGDPLGQRGSGRCCCGCSSAAACARGSSRAHSSTSPGCWGSPGARTCAT